MRTLYVKVFQTNDAADYRAGNKALKNEYPDAEINGSNFTLNGEVYTWHHHQDMTTMLPVKQKINNHPEVRHSGGGSVRKHNEANSNEPIIFKYPYDQVL